MPNVKFIICSIKREKDIFDMVRRNMEFLKTNKIKFTWPQQTVEEEYDTKKYESYKKWIEIEWAKRERGFTERLSVFFHEPGETKFTVEISNYGPLGFYNASNNTVTINLNTHLDAINTIMHEMIHIMLEPFIKKYNIEHLQKEFVVNTILKILKNE